MHYSRTAVWRETGFKMTCDRIEDTGIGSRLMRIENLNPQVDTQTVMTRWQIFRLALWLMRRAIV